MMMLIIYSDSRTNLRIMQLHNASYNSELIADFGRKRIAL